MSISLGGRNVKFCHGWEDGRREPRNGKAERRTGVDLRVPNTEKKLLTAAQGAKKRSRRRMSCEFRVPSCELGNSSNVENVSTATESAERSFLARARFPFDRLGQALATAGGTALQFIDSRALRITLQRRWLRITTEDYV